MHKGDLFLDGSLTKGNAVEIVQVIEADPVLSLGYARLVIPCDLHHLSPILRVFSLAIGQPCDDVGLRGVF